MCKSSETAWPAAQHEICHQVLNLTWSILPSLNPALCLPYCAALFLRCFVSICYATTVQNRMSDKQCKLLKVCVLEQKPFFNLHPFSSVSSNFARLKCSHLEYEIHKAQQDPWKSRLLGRSWAWATAPTCVLESGSDWLATKKKSIVFLNWGFLGVRKYVDLITYWTVCLATTTNANKLSTAHSQQ